MDDFTAGPFDHVRATDVAEHDRQDILHLRVQLVRGQGVDGGCRRSRCRLRRGRFHRGGCRLSVCRGDVGRTRRAIVIAPEVDSADDRTCGRHESDNQSRRPGRIDQATLHEHEEDDRQTDEQPEDPADPEPDVEVHREVHDQGQNCDEQDLLRATQQQDSAHHRENEQPDWPVHGFPLSRVLVVG